MVFKKVKHIPYVLSSSVLNRVKVLITLNRHMIIQYTKIMQYLFHPQNLGITKTSCNIFNLG